jgi:hypothetical protein
MNAPAGKFLVEDTWRGRVFGTEWRSAAGGLLVPTQEEPGNSMLISLVWGDVGRPPDACDLINDIVYVQLRPVLVEQSLEQLSVLACAGREKR